MKKRYLLLILILGFGVIFLLLINHATAPTLSETPKDAQDVLLPEAAPASKAGLITVAAPLPQSRVQTPLIVRGTARGNWYFEGSFPLVLTTLRGEVIAQGYATAAGDWMTTDFVPFSGTLEYELSEEMKGSRAVLTLKKDNPSGEPQFDDSLAIPVTL